VAKIYVSAEPLNSSALEEEVRSPERGAVVTFQGIVRRDRTGQGEIESLFYEAYEPMASREIEKIAAQTRDRWPDCRVAIRHRTGSVPAGEASVVIAVAAGHRAEAFDACRFAIDQIKSSVPVWKKEIFTGGGERWSAAASGHRKP
jgi:molybdopterin synthase catalytic subunit